MSCHVIFSLYICTCCSDVNAFENAVPLPSFCNAIIFYFFLKGREKENEVEISREKVRKREMVEGDVFYIFFFNFFSGMI